MTLLDALDTLAIVGPPAAFASAVDVCISRANFSVDLNVLVCEIALHTAHNYFTAHSAQFPSIVTIFHDCLVF
jgi:hypothetical protein